MWLTIDPPLIRRLATAKPYQLSLALLTCLACFGTAAGASTETCVPTSIAEDWSLGAEAVAGDGPVLDTIVADAMDLRVTVRTAAGMDGTLTLLDAAGEVVAVEPVYLGPGGAAEVVLMDALLGVPDRGFQHSLELQDVSAGLPETLAETPVRFGLDCPTADQCVYTVRRGLTTGTHLATPELIAGLEEAKLAGADDLLGFVLTHYPEATGAVYETALGFEPPPVDPVLSGDAGESSEGLCRCRWLPSFGTLAAPSQPVDVAFERQLVDYWNDGVEGYLAGQTVKGGVNAIVSGAYGTLGMHLLCTTFRHSIEIPGIHVNGNPLDPIELPVVSSCDAPCQTTVRHSVDTRLCAEGRVFGGGGQSASADLALNALWNVDGSDYLGVSAWADVESLVDGGQDTQQTRVGKSKTLEVVGESSVATLFLDGHFSIDAALAPDQSIGSYAYASMRSSYKQQVNGLGACVDGDGNPVQTLGGEGIHIVSSLDSDGGTGGGVVLERWGDPP